jgi:SAM-dependent methyltransferase
MNHSINVQNTFLLPNGNFVIRMNLKSFLSTFIPELINKTSKLFFPLSFRKMLALNLDGKNWFPFRHIISMALIRDWASRDANAFHRFLWSHHLGYAGYYEAKHAFGSSKLVMTRKMLFNDLRNFLNEQNKLKSPFLNIDSVFDVGCSSGYLLRFIETVFLPEVHSLEGLDIDKHAIETGRAYLLKNKSKIVLFNSDMSSLDNILRDRKIDLILCTGVLMYLCESDAKEAVNAMVKHCNKLLVIKELAHPNLDNSKLLHSEFRSTDKTFIHNIDGMVKECGGKVLFHRWEGPQSYDGQSVYFLFCSK